MASELAAGTVVAGRYRLERLLGKGGMGVVWAAEDVDSHARRALKLMKDAPDDPDARRRFVREARAAAAVRHPNVVTIVEVLELDDGAPVIVMELLEGESLRELLARVGTLALGELAAIALPVISAVGAAHALGIVHRDLKPENIFLARGPAGERVVKVVDFGIAKLTALDGDAMQSSGLTTAAVIGTPAYMAPEQVFGEADLDHRVDIWALGIIVYQCLSGVLPTQGDNIGQVLRNVVAKPFAPLAQLVPDLPDDVAALVAHMLAHERAERPADLREVAARLAPYTSARVEPFAGVPFLPTVPATLPPRRRPRLAIAGVVIVAALGGGAAWRWLRPTAVVYAPLAAPGAKLACPLLRAPGWLGAAAAATACERARVILGGRPERTVVPAELLELPRTPVDGGDPGDDVFADATARERSVLAARLRAAAYLDGEVAKQGADFAVALELRAPDTALLARGEGRGRGLYEAVRRAMTPLIASGLLPQATQLDPEIAEGSRTQEVDAALATLDLELAMAHNAGGLADECERFGWASGRVGLLGPMMRWLCAYTKGEPPPALALERSSEGFATWIRVRHLTQPIEAPDDAKRLHELRDRTTSPWSRSLLAALESCLVQASEPDRARTLALAAVADEPKNPDGYPCDPWGQLVSVLDGSRSATRAMQAWEPWNGISWLMQGLNEKRDDVALVALRRAYELSPLDTQVAGALADRLYATGKREAARGIAVAIGEGPYAVHPLEREILLSRFDASEARFAKALAGAQRAFEVSGKAAGWVVAQRFDAAWRALEIAAILGRARPLADQLIDRFVAPEPPALEGSVPLLLPKVAAICALASPDRVEPCFGRLQAVRALLSGAITPRTDDFVAGARHYAAHRYTDAARAWRPLLRDGNFADVFPDAMADAFDRADEPDLAEQVDQAAMRRADEFGGATLAHARAAERAARRGDVARARELAGTLVAAWQLADDDVPSAGAMKRLLARL